MNAIRLWWGDLCQWLYLACCADLRDHRHTRVTSWIADLGLGFPLSHVLGFIASRLISPVMPSMRLAVRTTVPLAGIRWMGRRWWMLNALVASPLLMWLGHSLWDVARDENLDIPFVVFPLKQVLIIGYSVVLLWVLCAVWDQARMGSPLFRYFPERLRIAHHTMPPAVVDEVVSWLKDSLRFFDLNGLRNPSPSVFTEVQCLALIETASELEALLARFTGPEVDRPQPFDSFLSSDPKLIAYTENHCHYIRWRLLR